MRIKVNHYSGESMLNTLRQIVLTRLDETRPIAFKVGAFSNVVTISDAVEEDMTEFISKVSASDYACTSNGLFVWKGEADQCLRTADLSGNGLSVSMVGQDELLHCFGKETVEIYFRTDSGKFTAEENREFLQNNSINTEDLVVINSRHSPASAFSFEKVEEQGENDIYEILILPKGGATEKSLLITAAVIFSNDLELLCSNLN
jgi:hypothetical protein